MHAFGSVVRSDYRHGESDIDLLVEFQPCEPGTLYRTYFSLLSELRKSLSAPVDLVMVDAVRNPYIKATIEAGKQEIYAACPAARGRGSKMPDPGQRPVGERAHRVAQGAAAGLQVGGKAGFEQGGFAHPITADEAQHLPPCICRSTSRRMRLLAYDRSRAPLSGSPFPCLHRASQKLTRAPRRFVQRLRSTPHNCSHYQIQVRLAWHYCSGMSESATLLGLTTGTPETIVRDICRRPRQRQDA